MTYPNQPAAPPPPQTMGSSNTVFITEARFDPSYLRTVPGMIKAGVILLNLLAYICIQSSPFWPYGRGVYFIIVSVLGFIFSGVMLMLYLFHIVEKYHDFKWLKVEMIAYVILTFLNLIAATMAVAFGAAGFSAAGFFGYLAMVLYGADAFMKAKALQSGALAQGHRVVSKTHITTPPALP